MILLFLVVSALMLCLMDYLLTKTGAFKLGVGSRRLRGNNRALNGPSRSAPSFKSLPDLKFEKTKAKRYRLRKDLNG